MQAWSLGASHNASLEASADASTGGLIAAPADASADVSMSRALRAPQPIHSAATTAHPTANVARNGEHAAMARNATGRTQTFCHAPAACHAPGGTSAAEMDLLEDAPNGATFALGAGIPATGEGKLWRMKPLAAELNYLVPMSEKPFVYMFGPPPGMPDHLGEYAPRAVTIFDARELSQASLEVEGFALVRHGWAPANVQRSDEVRRILYPEAERLILEATGVERAIVFDHNVRSAAQPSGTADARGVREAVRRAHNDYTVTSGPQRARDLLSSQPTELEGRRFAFVNVWRPLRGPVRDTPLAVCDARTIDERDLVATDMRYPDRTGETYALTFNPNHRWYFVPGMQIDEALLIKCFDSSSDGLARFSAHGAFDDPTVPPGGPPRESIELRALALYRRGSPRATIPQ
jgi:hypothetical protein